MHVGRGGRLENGEVEGVEGEQAAAVAEDKDIKRGSKWNGWRMQTLGSSTCNPAICCNQLIPFLLIPTFLMS